MRMLSMVSFLAMEFPITMSVTDSCWQEHIKHRRKGLPRLFFKSFKLRKCNGGVTEYHKQSVLNNRDFQSHSSGG